MSLNTVGTLPVGSYTGNASDLIQVVGEGQSTVEVDETFHDRGVPYQIGGPLGAFGLLVVDGDPTLATLTLEPGVEIRFYSAGRTSAGCSSASAAARSPPASSSPRTRRATRSCSPAPAAHLSRGAGKGSPSSARSPRATCSTTSRSTPRATTAATPASAARRRGRLGRDLRRAQDLQQPGSQFFTNSTISRSSTHGIFRAWTGAQVDFLPGNSFVDVPFCDQVLPKPPLPAICPAVPECP